MSKALDTYRAVLRGITRPGNGSGPTNPHNSPGFKDAFRLRVVGPDGTIKQETPWLHNTMCSFGLASLASRMGTASGSASSVTTELVSAMKIGTGTTAATSNDTSLVASTGSVTMGNASFTKTNLGNMTVEYQATFASNNPSGAASIQEVAMFCNSTGDNQCFARSVLSGAQSVNKGASDTIQCSYDIVLKTA